MPCIKDVWKDLPEERDQIWAEVMQAYNDNWPLILSPDIEQQANEERKSFKEEDPRRDQIVEFLETEIPENWYKLSLDVRRDYYFGDYVPEGVEMVKRDHITAVEIWVECFRRNETDFLKKDAAEINLILGNMPGWKRQKKQVRLDTVVYGGARRKISYVRKEV